MKQRWRFTKGGASRRSFLRDGIVAAGAATIGTKVLRSELSAFERDPEDRGPAITAGDVAILQFLTAAELIESDLWQQYNELGGIDAGNIRTTLTMTFRYPSASVHTEAVPPRVRWAADL